MKQGTPPITAHPVTGSKTEDGRAWIGLANMNDIKIRARNNDIAIAHIGDYFFELTPDGLPVNSGLLEVIDNPEFRLIFKTALELQRIHSVVCSIRHRLIHDKFVMYFNLEKQAWIQQGRMSPATAQYILDREWVFSQEQYPISAPLCEAHKAAIALTCPRRGFVYLLRSNAGYYKIGHTVNPNNRLRTFNVKLPFEVSYEHLIPARDRIAAEKELHQRFAARRTNGEWFVLTDEDVESIKAIKEL